ncbi:MAG: sigma-70 family RNA polymerase sigma factor, partial [Melioribacteraceae bacterium]
SQYINDKQRAQSFDELIIEDEDGELLYPEDMIQDELNLEAEIEAEYFHEAFLIALEELPPKQRDVFVLNELEDFTLQEIADKTGESIKTIISRKRYAVAHLREKLKPLSNK